MADYKTEDIRNIVVLGHSSCGKTSLSDALLYNAKTSTRFGKVDDGSSVFDYLEYEIERKISISTAIAQFFYKGKKINILDTPGYADFIGEPISAIRGADIAVIVIDAVEGPQFSTIKLMKKADEFNLSKIIFINKFDKENSNYEDALSKLKTAFSSGITPITVPVKENNQIIGVLNIFENKYFKTSGDKVEVVDIPDNLKSQAEEYRLKMIEAIAETDDKLMEEYFDKGSLPEEDIKRGFINGIVSNKIIPVFSGSAVLNVGVASLLDFILQSAPSPVDKPTVKAKSIDGEKEVECKPDANAPLKAFVFKTQAESHIGEINFVRVFSGTLKNGDEVYNSVKDTNEKIGQINFLFGKDKKETKELIAGDIGALVKLKSTSVGDTLCDIKEKIKFNPIDFPTPLLETAIVPKTKSDQEKLSISLHKLLESDPTISININAELKQTILSGMGEIHLNIFISNLKSKYNVEVEVAKPNIAYRETIKKKSKAQGKYKRQTGGRGQYGDCWLEIEPIPLNDEKNIEFLDKIVGGAIPGKYIPAVEKGVKEAMAKGVLANYPVIKVRVTVYDGSFHPVDSSDMAFQIAGSLAFKNAAKDAKPVLLEPIMKLKIYTPNEYMGDIISDLNSRRGKILGMEDESGLKVVNAYVPEAELYKYINDLKSMTQGSGTFEKEFAHYEEVPHEISQKIIEERKKDSGEE